MWIGPSLTQAIILVKIRKSAILVPVTFAKEMCIKHILSCKRTEKLLSGAGFCCSVGWSLLPFFEMLSSAIKNILEVD